MIATTTTNDCTWRLLWSHTAQRIVTELALTPGMEHLEIVAAGNGWGLRRRDNGRVALLLHPTADDSDAGDLSLTVLGVGTHAIPRASISYCEYTDLVEDAVETTARFYLR